MSTLITQIQMAQRDAGERAVIAHLDRTMGAKTNAERQRDYKAARAAEGLREVRGIYAHPDDAAAIREHAGKVARRRERAARDGAD